METKTMNNIIFLISALLCLLATNLSHLAQANDIILSKGKLIMRGDKGRGKY